MVTAVRGEHALHMHLHGSQQAGATTTSRFEFGRALAASELPRPGVAPRAGVRLRANLRRSRDVWVSGCRLAGAARVITGPLKSPENEET